MANFTGAIQADTLNIIKDKYFLRGLSHFKNKLINEALSDFNEYNKTESSKTDTAFYADYGTAQLFANQDTLAAKSFKQAIALSANNAKALYGLACYYAKIGQFDKTFDLFAKAFATHALTKEDIKPEEDTFLVELNKDKLNRNRYKELKKSYQNN
jgi:tetratricopeptide (TPR) repeat protein